MAGRSGHHGGRIEPPETAGKHESAIFRPEPVSANSQPTIAPSEGGILARSAGLVLHAASIGPRLGVGISTRPPAQDQVRRGPCGSGICAPRNYFCSGGTGGLAQHAQQIENQDDDQDGADNAGAAAHAVAAIAKAAAGQKNHKKDDQEQ